MLAWRRTTDPPDLAYQITKTWTSEACFAPPSSQVFRWLLSFNSCDQFILALELISNKTSLE